MCNLVLKFYEKDPLFKDRLKMSLLRALVFYLIVGVFFLGPVIAGIISGSSASFIVLMIAIYYLLTLYNTLKCNLLITKLFIHESKLHISYLDKDEHKLNILHAPNIYYNKATDGVWNITGVIIEENGKIMLNQHLIWKYWPKKYCKELVHWWEENKKHLENEMGGNGKGGNQGK